MNLKKITLIALSCIINFAYGASQDIRHYLKDLHFDRQDASRTFNKQEDYALDPEKQKAGEHRAASRLMQSFKQEKAYTTLTHEKKYAIEARKYCLDIKSNVPINPSKAFGLCKKMGPHRACTLLQNIIKHYPALHEEILNYLSSQKSKTGLPLIKYMANSGNTSAIAKYKAHCLKEKRAANKKRAQEQAQKNANFWAEKKRQQEEVKQQQEKKQEKAARKQKELKQAEEKARRAIEQEQRKHREEAIRKQKELKEQQEKARRAIEQEKRKQQETERAIQAAKEKKEREEAMRKKQEIALKKQKEQDEKDFARAKTYIKRSKYNQAKKILDKLANKGDRKALVEQGKIHQELMYKAIVQQAAAQDITKKTTSSTSKMSSARKRQIQKQKISSADTVSRYKESVLNCFKNAGPYGHYYTAKFCKRFAQFHEEIHHTFAQTAHCQARLTQKTSDQQKMLDAGKKKEDAALALWYNNTNIHNMQAAKKLEEQAVAYYKLATQKGDPRGWTRIGILHERLCDAKGNMYRKEAREYFSKVKNNDPNYAKALTHLACLDAGHGLDKEAIKLLKKACTQNSKYRKSFNLFENLCGLMFKRAAPDVPTIEDHLKFMIKHGGHTAQTHNLWGKCAVMRGNDEQAIEHFVKAGQKKLAEGWYHAGIISLKIKKTKDAKTYLKNACNLNGCQAKALVELGDIYASEGNGLKALQHYAAAARLGDSDAHYKLAQCFINGDGGIYNPKLAALHYEQSVVAGLPFGEIRKRKKLTQISKLQTPSCEDDVPKQEAQTIQPMVLNLIKVQPKTDEEEKLKVEALFAQSNLHSIRARKIHKSIDNINLCEFSVQKANQEIAQEKANIEQMKTEYVKNKNAIASSIARIRELTKHISIVTNLSIVTNYRQEIMHLKNALKLDPTNARIAYSIASRLQQHFFPKKKLSEMTQPQEQECNIAQGLYLRVIKGHANQQPHNYFVHKAICNISRIYKHQFPSTYENMMTDLCKKEIGNEVNRNIILAHLYETGLLSDDNKPDYQSAAKHITQALKLKPKKQYLRKEYAFYTYASNPSATLSKIDLAFILELTKKLNGNTLTATLGKRLQAYNQIDMGADDVVSSQGYDKNNQPIYTVNNGTGEQNYASCSSSNTK